MLNYGIIGFGALGKLLFTNLLRLEEERGDIRLAAICNNDISTINKNVKINIAEVRVDHIDFSKYAIYTDYKEMLKNEKLDFVIITLPSFLHGEVCTYCLNHGVNVYVEKPLAITAEECDAIASAEKRSGKCLMVGHCLRFSDEYVYLKKLIESGEYGKPIKAEFSRKSPFPLWSAGGWLLDEKKSGGCIVDMHVHDVDVMVWLFGTPIGVTSQTSHCRADYESAYALFKYPDMSVSVIGDWGLAATYEFRAFYGVTFEMAYVECTNGCVTLYTDDKKQQIELDNSESPYYREMREFVECVAEHKPPLTANIDSVYETMKLIFKEKYPTE